MEHKNHKHHSPYLMLFLMAVLSFFSMYILMYAMVDAFSDVFSNFNQTYMAFLMTAPMIIIEMFLMKAMYPNKKLNFLIVGGSSLVLILCFIFIRTQTAIGDKEFLKSMIPHHSGAVLMCENANLKDDRIKTLCGAIVSGQKEEIKKMKDILSTL